MTKAQKHKSLEKLITEYGADILDSEKYGQSDKYIQHGTTTTREHMISTACVSIKIARAMHLRCDEQSLVRGALLHDYFLYDWHEPEGDHPKHATRHSSYALKNASEDFAINPLEAEIIREHMFPCTLRIPLHRESWMLVLADKACAVKETFSRPYYDDIIGSINYESRKTNN